MNLLNILSFIITSQPPSPSPPSSLPLLMPYPSNPLSLLLQTKVSHRKTFFARGGGRAVLIECATKRPTLNDSPRLLEDYVIREKPGIIDVSV